MQTIPDPGFAGDDGAADPRLAAALAAYDVDRRGGHHEVLAALGGSRLLVPVVALPGEAAAVATVLMRGRDGRLAQLAFSCLDSMRAWDPAARPVPVPAPLAAASALQDGAEALVVDVAGPVRFVVEGERLDRLAARVSRAGPAR